jgi:thiol-disulfide isomerase/thioredoxin
VLRRRSFIALVALTPFGCAHRVPSDATRTIVSLQDIDCESCGARVVAAAEAKDGVYKAEFHRRTAEVVIRHDAARVAPADLLALAQAQNVQAVLGAGQGRYLPTSTYPAEADVQVISKAGELVQLEPHVAAGKVTVFDFYAAWCQPCRRVDEHLVELLRTRDDVAVRKLDIVDWDTPLAEKYLADVANLPFVVVYGKDGKQTAAISGLDLAAIDRAIAEGAK